MIILGRSAFKASPTKGPDEVLNGLLEGYMMGKQLSMEEKQLQASIAAQEARTRAMQQAQGMDQERMGWEREDRAANLAAGEALGQIGTGGSRARKAQETVQGTLNAVTGAVSQAMGIPLPTMKAPPGAISGVLRKEHQETIAGAARLAAKMPMTQAMQFMDMVKQRVGEDEIQALRGEVKQEIISAFQAGLLDDVDISGKAVRSPQTAAQVEQWLGQADNPATNIESINSEFRALMSQKGQAAALEQTITSTLEANAKRNQGRADMGIDVPWAEVQSWRNKLRYGEIDVPTFQAGASNLADGLVPIFDPINQKDHWVKKGSERELGGLMQEAEKNRLQPEKFQREMLEREGVIKGMIESIRGDYDLMKLGGEGDPAVGDAIEKLNEWSLGMVKDNPSMDPDEIRALGYEMIEGNMGIRLPRQRITQEQALQDNFQHISELMSSGMNREDATNTTIKWGKMRMRTREYPLASPEEQAKAEAKVIREAIKPPTDRDVLLQSGVELVPGELAKAKAEVAAVVNKVAKLQQDAVDGLIEAGYDGPPPLSRATWAKALYWAQDKGGSEVHFEPGQGNYDSKEEKAAQKARRYLRQVGRKKGWALPSTDEERRKLREELIQELRVGAGNP